MYISISDVGLKHQKVIDGKEFAKSYIPTGNWKYSRASWESNRGINIFERWAAGKASPASIPANLYALVSCEIPLNSYYRRVTSQYSLLLLISFHAIIIISCDHPGIFSIWKINCMDRTDSSMILNYADLGYDYWIPWRIPAVVWERQEFRY